MVFGPPFGAPFSAPFSSSFSPTKFDIEKPIGGHSILVVSQSIGKELIDHFTKYPQQLKTFDRRRFEELVQYLLKGFGYSTELTKQTRDGGKDIIAVRNELFKEKFLIECKRPDEPNKVPVSAVRELLGVKTHEKATKGILVTTGYFTSDARLFIDEHEWELEGKDFDELVKWIQALKGN